jgi:hypothetical protein
MSRLCKNLFIGKQFEFLLNLQGVIPVIPAFRNHITKLSFFNRNYLQYNTKTARGQIKQANYQDKTGFLSSGSGMQSGYHSVGLSESKGNWASKSEISQQSIAETAEFIRYAGS